MRKILLIGIAAISVATLASPSSAAFLDVPVPANAYITVGGLDWAWASPLPAGDELLTAFQASQGWRVPTAADFANAPLATQFLFAGANVPFNGTDPISGAMFQALNSDYTNAGSAGACATPYFSGDFHHCDWQDGLGQPNGPWNGMPGANGLADQLYVRDAVAGVPEPAAWALMIGGFVLAGAALRRRTTVSYTIA